MCFLVLWSFEWCIFASSRKKTFFLSVCSKSAAMNLLLSFSLSRVQLFDIIDLPVFCYLPESTQADVHRFGDGIQHLILCRPLRLSSVFPSIRVFSNELALCIRWPKYWSLSFSISPSNEYSGLIYFRIDWFDLLAVQRRDSEESSPPSQFRSINSSALSLLCVLSHPYMTT